MIQKLFIGKSGDINQKIGIFMKAQNSRFTKDEAEGLLIAHENCRSEGQAGIPKHMLLEIQECFPVLAEQFKWLYNEKQRP